MTTESVQRAPRQDKINRTLWDACDTLRGPLDAAEYKDYILPLLFYKYISDVWRDKRDQFESEFENEPPDRRKELVDRRMRRLPFQVPEGKSFYDAVKAAEAGATRDEKGEEITLGEFLNQAFYSLEDANGDKLNNVFRDIDYNRESKLGRTKERNRILTELLEHFNDPILDFRPSVIGNRDLVGEAYMYLIEKFAESAGKKGGEFFTPRQVSKLLARLMDPEPGSRIYDPTMGSGSLAIAVAEYLREKYKGDPMKASNFALYGQEITGGTWSMAKMNAVLHDMDAAKFEWGDTLSSPRHVVDDGLMKFDIVVANPPFSLKSWGYKEAQDDPFKRFHRGVPPRTRGDYAFISHMVETAVEGTGKVGVIVPHGVLFRGGAEGIIREKLVRENLLDAVIGLPEKLFYGTGIPAAILIFNKGKERSDTLFVDASEHYEPGTRQNILRDEDIDRVVDAFRHFREGGDFEGIDRFDKFARCASMKEIEENGFNLNVPRYVDTFEPEPVIDIKKVQREVLRLENELTELRGKMNKALRELGLSLEEDATHA